VRTSRSALLAVIVVGLFSVLVLRLWSIQVLGHSSAETAALQTSEVAVAVEPPRGAIVARGGQVFAADESREVVTLTCPSPERSSCPALDFSVISRLAPLLGTTVTAIDASVQSNQIAPYDPAPVAVGVPYSTVAYLYEHPSEFPGVAVSPTYLRTYPEGSLAAQMVGYVGDITADEYASVDAKKYAAYGYTAQDSQFGQSGLEEQYELKLRGKPGVQTIEVNAAGTPVATRSTSEPTPGDELVLNLDQPLEQLLATDLDNQVVRLRAGDVDNQAEPAPWAGAVVLDDRTGAVLAMTSDPSYNENLWVPEISEKSYLALTPPATEAQPLINYAVEDGNPPGSTFKLATATAALQDGVISPGDYIDDTGSFTIGNETLHNSNGEVLGEVNVSEALTESSDIFFYTMGEDFYNDQKQFGATPIQNEAAKYGLGVSSGIDLPNVSNGQVDSLKLREQLYRDDPKVFAPPTWYPADNVEMAFGQGETLLTPLAIADAYATFANGGTRYAPEMAGAFVSPTDKVTYVKPKVTGHVAMSSSTYQAILTGLEGVTQDTKGTAYTAFQGFNFNAWNIAGKTGTATLLSNTEPPTSWFVAFGGPRNQTPEYTVAVEINQAGYGADASAPVVRSIFNYLYAHGVPGFKLPHAKADSASATQS